ncbi:MAG: hypothetical protein ABI281_12665 [Caldimonas sp.]
MPWRLLRALGIVVPRWRELARMSYLWRVPHALDGRALEAAVGPLPGTPLIEALKVCLPVQCWIATHDAELPHVACSY